MFKRTFFIVPLMMLILVQTGNAAEKNTLQEYFNDTACNVKATDDPAQKREILNESLQTMSESLNRVQSSPLISKEDRAGIDSFKATLQEKMDELAGLNGYKCVPDAQLDAFSDYVVQDMEQAMTMSSPVTVSLLAVVLIAIIVVLLV